MTVSDLPAKDADIIKNETNSIFWLPPGFILMMFPLLLNMAMLDNAWSVVCQTIKIFQK